MIIENEGQGLIFTNSYADENPNAPSYTGQINVGGEQYRIALWEKEFTNGVGFSVNIQPVEASYDEPEIVKKSSSRTSKSRSSSVRERSGRVFTKPRR